MVQQLNEVQKKWVDSFLEKSGGNGATTTGLADTPGLGGLDSGQVGAQAITPGQVGQVVAPVAQKAWDWITKEGVTTIVIENWTSKVLRFRSKELTHPKESIFFEFPPTEILAAKGPNDPTTVTMSVKTDKWIRGVTRADTSGFVVYDIGGTDKQRTIAGKTQWVKAYCKAAWSRKGQGQFDDIGTVTDLGGHKFEVQQVKDGTITYRFTEETPAPKPKDPQSPEDKKPKESPTPTDTKLKAPLEFTIKPFAVGKHDKLDKGGDLLQRAHEIWNDERLAAIKPAILQKLPAGQLKIEVHGYTSNTDTAARNFDLSKRRAEAVIAALKKVGVPATGFTEPQSHGEWETTPTTDDRTQEKEDDEWRKVVVKISQ